MELLVLNPGGNSLKAEVVHCRQGQRHAFEAEKRLSVIIEGIGKSPELAVMRGKKKTTHEPIAAADYGEATAGFVRWWKDRRGEHQADAIAVRVVHGGPEFDAPVRVDQHVLDKIAEFEGLAPLHNKSSLEVLHAVAGMLPRIPVWAVFDTAFHRTMPRHASSYAIPLDVAEKHGIRRYGFHGLSHRYLLERYAHLVGKVPSSCSVVTLHLESGCSATAIQQGRSIDNTMGLTPLEGLMMGTRSGDIDPAAIALLMRERGMTVDEVMTLLNRESGLKGVSDDSLDTRVLMKKYGQDAKVTLAIDMFAYRVRKAVGAYLAALGGADAVIFGGGIGENAVLVRKIVCEGLRGFGLEMDAAANERLIDVEGRLSTAYSRLQSWVIPTEEGMQAAHECFVASLPADATGRPTTGSQR